MGRFSDFSQNLEKQYRQIVYLGTDLLEQVKQYKETSGATSLSYACGELVKLGLMKAREISDRTEHFTDEAKKDLASRTQVGLDKTPLEKSWCCSNCVHLDLCGDLPDCNSTERYLVSPPEIKLVLAASTVALPIESTECPYKVEGVNKVYG